MQKIVRFDRYCDNFPRFTHIFSLAFSCFTFACLIFCTWVQVFLSCIVLASIIMLTVLGYEVCSTVFCIHFGTIVDSSIVSLI